MSRTSGLSVSVGSARGVRVRLLLQVRQAIDFADSFPERSEAVTALIVQPGEWQRTYRTIGELRATQNLELRTEVDGKISLIGFVGGDRIKQGQLLLQLDSVR